VNQTYFIRPIFEYLADDSSFILFIPLTNACYYFAVLFSVAENSLKQPVAVSTPTSALSF